MKYKIGIYGSAIDESASDFKKAKELGRALSRYPIIAITGACSGVPYEVVYEAAKNRVEIWGFTSVTKLEDQKKITPNDDLSIYKKLFFVPKEFEFSTNELVSKKYRNVISTAHCDAGIIVAGRWGTLNEFSNLIDMGKIIGVLTGTGGVADELPALFKKIHKDTGSVVLFDNSATDLLEKVINQIKIKNDVSR